VSVYFAFQKIENFASYYFNDFSMNGTKQNHTHAADGERGRLAITTVDTER
jgi:hypothetical protein